MTNTKFTTAKSLLAIGALSALLGAQWVNAQPAHERDRHPPQHQHKPPHKPPHHAPPQYRPLPKDFRDVRSQAYRNRHHIGPGPLPPKGYKVVRGKRLVGNIGQPLTWQQQKYLPYYRGHEWRRLGRDLLLVDSSSGVVIELFENVL